MGGCEDWSQTAVAFHARGKAQMVKEEQEQEEEDVEGLQEQNETERKKCGQPEGYVCD